MSWTLLLQIVILIVVVGAVGNVWIESFKRLPRPPKGHRFIDPQGGKHE